MTSFFDFLNKAFITERFIYLLNYLNIIKIHGDDKMEVEIKQAEENLRKILIKDDQGERE